MVSAKISIIGAGFVGSTTAFALIQAGLASELILVDLDRVKSEGEALDLSHGISFVRPVRIESGTLEDCKGSSIVIFTAGVSQKPGEKRMELAGRNIKVLKDTLPRLQKICPDAIILMVTNPVDILTYAAIKIGGFSPRQVIGSGTVLDSSRFRQALSEHYGIDARSIHAYVVGEHGDSEVALWSHANIAGARLKNIKNLPEPDRNKTFTAVRNAAYQIIERKGATYYAIALSLKRIVEAILGDENSILSISSLVEGQYDINDICLSLPCLVNSTGRKMILELDLNVEEKKALQQSADNLKEIIKNLGIVNCSGLLHGTSH